MTLLEVLDEIGEDAAGTLWPVMRARVVRYMAENPVQVARWRRRIIEAVEDGRL